MISNGSIFIAASAAISVAIFFKGSDTPPTSMIKLLIFLLEASLIATVAWLIGIVYKI